MKKTLIALGLALLIGNSNIAGAQGATNQTLFDMNQFAKDHKGGHTAKENFVVKWGGGQWTGICGSNDEWIDVTTYDEQAMNVEIEVDIEQFVTLKINENKVYFHWTTLGTEAPKTATITGNQTSNSGQAIGLIFPPCESIIQADGKIVNGMLMAYDVYGPKTTLTADQKFDLKILMSYKEVGGTASATSLPPTTFSNGSSYKAMWWDLNAGKPGSYDYSWEIEMLPKANQPDGNYKFDPRVSSMPLL